MKIRSAALIYLVACGPVDEGEGLLGTGWLDPYPNAQLLVDGQLALPGDAIPTAEGGTPIPVERVAWRDGFSPAQSAVVRGLELVGGELPTWRSPTPGAGGVQLFDLDAERFLPVMAELDAHPAAVDDPALLIRPLEGLPPGHRIAVIVMRDVAERPERFDQLVRRRPPASLAPHRDHYRELMNDLDSAGIDTEQIALAWDFPVATSAGRPLTSALSQAAFEGEWNFTRIRNADAGDQVAPMTWRAAEGTLATRSFLIDDELLALDPAEGTVASTGVSDAFVYVHIPESVADAEPGTVPVLFFGHGIFSQPQFYLDESDDPNGLNQLANEGGYIVVALKWRGLTYTDLDGTLSVANDFGRIPLIGDRLVQAQANLRAALDAVREGDLLTDPIFQGRHGEPLPDAEHVVYYGISLGGIQGSVFMAQQPPVEAGVLHVPGSMWSTMLERSSNWPIFEELLTRSVTDPGDRQLLYSLSQLWWDPVDPMTWAWDLGPSDLILVQEALGDQQVPNLTTRALARTIGLDVQGPVAEPPWSMEVVEGEFPPGSRAFTQFDPLLGSPPDVNRPAEQSGAHEAPRGWESQRRQTLEFLERGSVGRVVHPCGDAPCTADNPDAD